MPADALDLPVYLQRLLEVLTHGRVMPRTPAGIHLDRLALGRDAIFSESRASDLLPIGRRAATAWMRSRGLVFELEGARCVRWGAVLDALESEAATHQTEDPTPGVDVQALADRFGL